MHMKTTHPPAAQWRFKILAALERGAALLQGKGYGSSTITQEVKLVSSLLDRPPSLAIDIGCNIGDYTAELRRRHPQLEVHSFEPSVTNLAKLKARFAGDPQVVLVPSAVSSENGAATLYSNEPGSGLGSLTKRKLDHFDVAFDVTEQVRTVRFENYWIEKLARRPIDIMKVDIEGHELEALKGLGNALAATRLIQFEFGGCNIDTRTYFQDFWYFCQEKGFSLCRITPIGLQRIARYGERDEAFFTTNYIAVNTRTPSA